MSEPAGLADARYKGGHQNALGGLETNDTRELVAQSVATVAVCRQVIRGWC